MNVVRVKEGVEFEVIAPGGFRILSALDQASETLATDLMITSGTDGEHSGPNDPHHRGEAYDVRSQGFDGQLKGQVLNCIMGFLSFDRFYGFLEDAGTENEHFHFQTKKGTVYP